jgi:hypothetical protein
VPKNTINNRSISEITVNKNKEGSIEAAEAISALNKAERRRLNITSELIPHIILLSSAPTDIVLITPVK